MPTIWGHLEKVEELSACSPHIQVRTFFPGGVALRVRINIEAKTLVMRGTEAVDVVSLREGEFVEVSYRHGREGRLDADTIMVREKGRE
jgi:hypothetical protein